VSWTVQSTLNRLGSRSATDQAAGSSRRWHDRRRRPSSQPQIRSELEQATDCFERLGYTVVFGPHHREVHGYLAGVDEHRAADLQWALSEPGIDMVHMLGGGYGAARLYPRIDWDALGDPRIVCGFSDITAVHLALAKHGPWTTFYGPNFSRFTRRKDELTDETKAWFHRAFTPEPLGRVFEDPENPYVLTIGGGSAEAPIVGGCMTLVCHSIGTPYEIDTDGCILMIEDLDEEPYMVDAGLHHLIRAGKFEASRASCSAPTPTSRRTRSRSTSAPACRSRRSSTS